MVAKIPLGDSGDLRDPRFYSECCIVSKKIYIES